MRYLRTVPHTHTGPKSIRPMYTCGTPEVALQEVKLDVSSTSTVLEFTPHTTSQR